MTLFDKWREYKKSAMGISLEDIVNYASDSEIQQLHALFQPLYDDWKNLYSDHDDQKSFDLLMEKAPAWIESIQTIVNSIQARAAQKLPRQS